MIMDRTTLKLDFQDLAAQLMLETEVFSDGPTTCNVAIVGEGPGETELRHPQRLPFVGGAGNLLWDSLRSFGLNRTNVYTTNVVKRQISLSRKGNERHIVHRDELDKWIGMLRWELEQLPNINTIFAMGNYALEAVYGASGVTNWRGSVINATLPNGRRGRIVCAYNPAYAIRELKFEPVFRMDCKKLDLVARNVFKEHKVDAIINPTFRESMAFIRDLERSERPVSFDIETMNTTETVCYGLSNNAHKAICINLRDKDWNRFTVPEERSLLLALQRLCDSHRIVAQNGSFDTYHEWLRNGLRIRIWFDTLLAHHTLYPQLPHSLAFLVSQYTTHPFYKDEGRRWKEGGDVDSYWIYNCTDAATTYACYEGLAKELKAQGQEKFFFDHVMRAQPHLVEAAVHGVQVDMSVRDVIADQVNRDVDEYKAEFHRHVQELTGEPDYYPNPGSWQQLQDLFFNRLKLKGKGTSTDEANRENIMKDSSTPPQAREMISALTRWKKEDKFRGTYVESRVSPDGRFRCEYKQYGVARAPGRLSSAALIYGEGGNMQNQPMRARSMYVADPGCVLLYFDLAQAEARVVAYRANIPKWKDQFEQARIDGKYDCHRALASEMFKVEYDNVPTKDWNADGSPTIRYVAKRCRHGLNYRMEKWKLAEVTDLPFHQASRAWSVYHAITPELRAWWGAEEKQFKLTREIYNGMGRRFKVIQRIDDDVLDSIIAFYPQSTIGDKVTRVWYMCEEDDAWPDRMYARIAIDVHDNLVPIAHPRYAKTCLRIMKKHAESPIMVQDVYKNKPEPLIVPAELKMSYPTLWDGEAFVEDPQGLHRWSHMREVHL
jgi:DNA polymerase I - 3''-5'' exonuclease and polymerase domains